jgi:phospholipid/cholesterol/gamma-HCH transport system permease protein
MNDLIVTPKGWIEAFGEIVKFTSKIVSEVFRLKPLRFFGETLRQAGILIVSSTLVIWGLVFIIGLQCGIEGAYFTRGQGAPAYAGVFSAWCDLRELVPYAFGYMMAAKVGTGIVAELGSMRISDEIDALEVMGISGITFLCATRLMAAWLVLPFVYICSMCTSARLGPAFSPAISPSCSRSGKSPQVGSSSSSGSSRTHLTCYIA